MNTPLFEIVGLEKRFGGLLALDQIELTILEGSITGLIGPNGAGKTTLFNIITGHYAPDKGRLIFRGQPLPTHAPHRVAELGIARTFQNIRLFHNMTALENVMVGRHVRTQAGILGAVLGLQSAKHEEEAILERALELLEFVGIRHRANQVARTLPYGDQRRLEIARALATDPKLLALDEPAAGMNETERLLLMALLRRIQATGVTLLLIEHDMTVVMGLCQHVAVLDYGRLIAAGDARDIQNHPEVIRAYLGAEISP